MRILALDQATAISGYAILEDGVCVESGVIEQRQRCRKANWVYDDQPLLHYSNFKHRLGGV